MQRVGIAKTDTSSFEKRISDLKPSGFLSAVGNILQKFRKSECVDKEILSHGLQTLESINVCSVP